ncbi:DUF6538 domain-containing protein [Uliginosibacterium sp. 31-12]|uniref:DUF6538 domain-containing protein n=1 Tax=Uliginosibacterium sp. 31-12 TaxID=3062781 RepID=UPI0026E39B58|nr:DUF6538 domain-containing protein [Uliginosibacterium sp. 31-12]MDO6385269.1 tyrosine-type recombinase/integrase [Uliginosibacterium sp. 31-12]
MKQHNHSSLLSLLVFRIKNTYVRDGWIYFQRSVPKDLREHYGTVLIKHPLNTKDHQAALRQVERLNARYELEWAQLRSGAMAVPTSAMAQGRELLLAHGIDPHDPSPDEILLGRLLDPFEDARQRHAAGCEVTYRESAPAEYLTPAQLAALELLKPKRDTMADALEVYLAEHVKGDSKELRKSSTIAVTGFVAAVPNKAMLALTRDDAKAYRDAELARGVKTTTVRRRFRALHAIYAAYVLEKVMPHRPGQAAPVNPFGDIRIKGEGTDAETGKPLSATDWLKAAQLCREKDDPIRWLLALQLGTGTRVGEPAGLLLDDLRLDGDIPSVIYTRNEARGIKTDKPAQNGQAARLHRREVPLVGAALWAARRIKETAKAGQLYAFPQYIGDDGRLQGGSASATLNKWLKAQGIDHTTHDFRHTLRDRLRAVECPKEIQDEITGHAAKDTGTRVYGEGHPLSIRQKYLQLAAGDS